MDITRKIVERLSIKYDATELGEVMAWLEEQDYDIIRSGALRITATKAAKQLHTVGERVIDEMDCAELEVTNFEVVNYADSCSTWDDPIIEFNPKCSIRIPATFHFYGKLPPPDFSEELEESNAILREIASEFHMDSLRRVEAVLQEARELLLELADLADGDCCASGPMHGGIHTENCPVRRAREWLAAPQASSEGNER